MTADAKEALIESAEKLLQETNDTDKITSRAISSSAGVNLALINYYFGSKDELLKVAVSRIVERSADGINEIDSDKSPKEAMYDFLVKSSEIMVDFEKYTKYYVPDILLKDEIAIPKMIVPFIESHFKGTKTNTECRFIAYQIVSTLQLILYRMDDVSEYLGVDIRDKSNIECMISKELDIMLPEMDL